ncbi:MAG: cation:proton antiporter subunit C [Alphaproteobacteria bacterium]|jgi:multicomponent Na+:H+ antiporter subunit C|nr:cation:proton antiporter subunit C [Alphaproteobacteria bacterium]
MQNFSTILSNYPYIIAALMIVAGLYILMIEQNLIKKIIGMNIMQGGIIIFFVLIGKIRDGLPPVYNPNNPSELLSNPLPHVLMLTAIVVGIAVTAVACSLIYIVYRRYGTINERELAIINKQDDNDYIITEWEEEDSNGEK